MEEGVINFQGMKVRIFLDLTTEMAQFQDLRAKLCKYGTRHGIIHPATLIINFKEEKKYFKNHEVAETYFNTVIKSLDRYLD